MAADLIRHLAYEPSQQQSRVLSNLAIVHGSRVHPKDSASPLTCRLLGKLHQRPEFSHLAGFLHRVEHSVDLAAKPCIKAWRISEAKMMD